MDFNRIKQILPDVNMETHRAIYQIYSDLNGVEYEQQSIKDMRAIGLRNKFRGVTV